MNEHTENTAALSKAPAGEDNGHVGRAVVAWLVAAVMAVAVIAILTIEANAAPLGLSLSTMPLSRESALVIFAGLGVCVLSVTILIWRDAYLQARRQLSRGRH